MKEIKFTEVSQDLLLQLMKGAFLTVKDKDNKINTMTIAWGALGYMWRKPVFIVMVRKSRYTHGIIENAGDFTVNFPLNDKLKEALSICGTKSGRNIDKFKECNLTLTKSQKVSTEIISECKLNLECKIVYKQDLDPDLMTDEIKQVYSEDKDYHTLYYGEILSSYLI